MWRPSPRLIALAVLVLVALVASIAMIRRTVRPDPARLLRDAEASLTAGNYHAAQAGARAAVSGGASGGAAHVLIARAALLLDDGLVAEAELDRAAAAGTSDRELHGWRAHARLLQGDPAGALAEAAQVPRSVYATRVRARALAASGNPSAAQAALLALVAARPKDGAGWTDLARLRLTLGDVGGAADAAGRAVALARGEPGALTLAGEIVRTRYGLRAALPWFTAALARDASYHPALIERAATLGDLGGTVAMLADTRRALAARPGSAQAFYLQAVLAARAGRDDLARRLLQRTGGALDGVPGVMLLGGALDYRRGDYDQAAEKWRRLVEAQPLDIAARRLLGLALLRSGDPRGSLDALAPMLMRADADAYTLRLAARALERTGDRAGAAVLIDRAAAGGGPSRPLASETAVGALAAAVSAAPGDPTLGIGLIRGLLNAGDTAGAVAQAQALVGASPGAPAARVALGDALTGAGRAGEAAGAYRAAADLAFDAPTMLRLVDALGRLRDGRGAAAALALYLGQNAEAVDARRILGRWQAQAGDHAGAIRTLEGVHRASGGRDAGLLADLSIAFAGVGRNAEALRHGRAAYMLAPGDRQTIGAYAAALARAGDAGAAAQLEAKERAIAGAGPAS